MLDFNDLIFKLETDVINFKTDLKYKLKKSAIELSLRKLSATEINKLMECVNQAVSFWVFPVREHCHDIKDEERKREKLADIDKFRNYLTLNTLYQLVVKKEECVYIHMSWDPMENLSESVRDSEISCLYMPVKTYMFVYGDKVMLDDTIYYDSLQNSTENLNSMNSGERKTKLKSINEYLNLFSNNK